jgi:predicted lipid-binding transport protein (Tim44 family)
MADDKQAGLISRKLLDEVDQAAREEAASRGETVSRRDLMERALRRELARIKRKEKKHLAD